MGFLLLGIDSLIACIALGPIVGRRSWLLYAMSFGICDGAGFLLGLALHWHIAGSTADLVTTATLVGLGLYWLAVALLVKRGAGTRWIWALPAALSLDNITFGVLDSGQIGWEQAGEQALSSAVLAGVGLLLGVALARAVPALRRSAAVRTGMAGGALLVVAPVLLIMG